MWFWGALRTTRSELDRLDPKDATCQESPLQIPPKRTGHIGLAQENVLLTFPMQNFLVCIKVHIDSPLSIDDTD